MNAGHVPHLPVHRDADGERARPTDRPIRLSTSLQNGPFPGACEPGELPEDRNTNSRHIGVVCSVVL